MKSRLSAALAVLAMLAFGLPAAADSPSAILNVSYDPTREFYTAYNALFNTYWKKKTGQNVTVNQSHGGSGAQARAVIEGLEADVVTLALAYDIDAISDKAKSIAPNWQERLPNNSTPYTSTIDFVVRKGNPKHIRDWGDLVRPGVAVITPNPKTSGGARWNFLAAYGWAQKHFHGNAGKVKDYMQALYKNVPVLDSGARGATTTFSERGIGDVLISWENEAFLLQRGAHGGDYQIITPSVSVLAEPPVAWVDANVSKHGTTALAKAYLQYLYTADAQKLICKNGYRPTMVSVMGKCGTHFERLDLVNIGSFGGWKAAQARFFADGGMFDQIYQPH